MNELGHFPCGAQCLRKNGDALLDEIGAKPARNQVHVCTGTRSTRRKRPGQSFTEFVNALNGRSKETFRRRPATSGEIEPLAASLEAAREAMMGPVLKLRELPEEF
jgi:hypothetical protein